MFIRSERLMLRPVFAEDWREIFDGIGDEQVARMLIGSHWPYGADAARAYCSRPRGSADMQLAITLPGDSGAPIIGMIALTRDVVAQSHELECWIARSRQRQGYGSEAVGALLATARSLGIFQVLGRHCRDNPAGRKILQNWGFVPKGEPAATTCYKLAG